MRFSSNNREVIFAAPEGYVRFADASSMARKIRCAIHAYALMTNLASAHHASEGRQPSLWVRRCRSQLRARLVVWNELRRGRDVAPFVSAMGLFAMCYLGLAISLFPYIVPPTITLWDAAAPQAQAFLLIGTLFLLPIILMYTGWSYWGFLGRTRLSTSATRAREPI